MSPQEDAQLKKMIRFVVGSVIVLLAFSLVCQVWVETHPSGGTTSQPTVGVLHFTAPAVYYHPEGGAWSSLTLWLTISGALLLLFRVALYNKRAETRAQVAALQEREELARQKARETSEEEERLERSRRIHDRNAA